MILQVGVKVLLKNKEGNILILKRSEQKYGKTNGSWDIPGGRIDPGSGLLQNLKREVMEETGLSILSEPKLIAAQDILRDNDKHVVRLTYTAHTDGMPQLDTSENEEYRWIDFGTLAAEKDLDIYVKELFKKGFLRHDSWVAHERRAD